MSDFLTRLAERSLGLGQPVQPFVAPRMTPAAEPAPIAVETPAAASASHAIRQRTAPALPRKSAAQDDADRLRPERSLPAKPASSARALEPEVEPLRAAPPALQADSSLPSVVDPAESLPPSPASAAESVPGFTPARRSSMSAAAPQASASNPAPAIAAELDEAPTPFARATPALENRRAEALAPLKNPAPTPRASVLPALASAAAAEDRSARVERSAQATGLVDAEQHPIGATQQARPPAALRAVAAAPASKAAQPLAGSDLPAARPLWSVDETVTAPATPASVAADSVGPWPAKAAASAADLPAARSSQVALPPGRPPKGAHRTAGDKSQRRSAAEPSFEVAAADSSPPAPVVRVNIGRVELRMAAAPKAAAVPPRPRLSLRDFLKQ